MSVQYVDRFTCDRCGTSTEVIAPAPPQEPASPPNGWQTTLNIASGEAADLCPACVNALAGWFTTPATPTA